MSRLISVCKRANTLICVNSNAFENLVLVTPIDIIEIGDAVNIGAGIGFFAHVIFAQGDEILRLTKWKWPQQHCVENAKHRRICANPKRKSKDDIDVECCLFSHHPAELIETLAVTSARNQR